MSNADPLELARRLIGDLSLEQFHRAIRERHFARFGAAVPAPACHEVYNVDRLDTAVANSAIPPLFMDLYGGSQLVKLADILEKSGKTVAAVIVEQLSQGATLRIRELQKFDARIAQLAGAVQRLFAARSQINLYLTPPRTAGFPPHFDITDVFILQCSGAKQWTIFESYANQHALPLPQTAWEPQRYQTQGAGEKVLLDAGDVLYLPRGAMHSAACLDQTSLHLTISLAPLTVADVLMHEVRRFADSDETIRRRALWSAGNDAAALTEQIRECFRSMAVTANSEECVGKEREAIFGAHSQSTDTTLAACLAGLEGK